MAYGYPKIIPEPNLQTELDETGFTILEKITLKNAWWLIREKLRRYSSEIFLDSFTECEWFIERFRKENGILNMEKLHQHPKSVLKFFGRLIDEGLENQGNLSAILTELVDIHKRFTVPAADVALLSNSVKDHLLVALQNLNSPTLDSAMEKLTQAVNDMHESLMLMEETMISASDFIKDEKKTNE